MRPQDLFELLLLSLLWGAAYLFMRAAVRSRMAHTRGSSRLRMARPSAGSASISMPFSRAMASSESK